MFGYVLPWQDELKVRELREYRAYYCGLCSCLKKNYGLIGQLSLNYDLTFLGILLTALYEPNIREEYCRCIAHPVHKHLLKQSIYVQYAADMNILLTYYKCMDDWQDEHKFIKAGYGKMLFYKGREIIKKYPQKAKSIEKGINRLSDAEDKNCSNIDYVSGCFGDICSAIFVYHDDEWADDLKRMGYFLGKFIYLIDAYEDMEKDKKKQCYNPFVVMDEESVTEKKVYQILLMMMSEASRAFERLPIVQNIEILRNIIYSGVWCHFYKNAPECADGGNYE